VGIFSLLGIICGVRVTLTISSALSLTTHGIMPNLTHVDPYKAPVLAMQDDLGIVYHIESAQQFWSGAL
jgi:hypothetical protein